MTFKEPCECLFVLEATSFGHFLNAVAVISLEHIYRLVHAYFLYEIVGVAVGDVVGSKFREFVLLLNEL